MSGNTKMGIGALSTLIILPFYNPHHHHNFSARTQFLGPLLLPSLQFLRLALGRPGCCAGVGVGHFGSTAPPLPPPSRYVALLTAPRRPLPPPPRIYFLQRDLLNYNTVTENQTYTRKDKESTTWATIALRYQSPKSTMENIIQVLLLFFCCRMTATGK